MKIVIYTSFYRFRNDIRILIENLSVENVVITYTSDVSINETANDKSVIFWNKNYYSLVVRVIIKIYSLFKQLPKSKSNYYLMELLKGHNIQDPKLRAKAIKNIKLERKLPEWISYDRLLQAISLVPQVPMEPADVYLFLTEIIDDKIYQQALESGKTVLTYVYSWDHPCKHTRFSNLSNYLVWSESSKQDVSELQGIPDSKIHIVGSTQFGFVHKYLSKMEFLKRSYKFKYIYFGCAIGITPLVKDELKVVRGIAERLKILKTEWKLVVRAYPVLENWVLYEELNDLDNVVVEEDFRGSGNNVSESEILKKFERIENAEYFFHLGSTIGVEAAFTDTPSFILDFGYDSKYELSLYSFIHQFQNQKYLMDPMNANILNSYSELDDLVLNIPKIYLKGNLNIREKFDVASFEEVSNNILAVIKDKSTLV